MILRLNIETFPAMAETRAALAQAGQDPRLSRSRLGIHDGGIAAAIAYFAENPTPHVIMIEETGSDRDMMAGLENLANAVEPGVKVVVIGKLNDIGLYRSLVSQGISEYLLAPPSSGQIVDAITGLYREPGAAPRGRTIAFYGARGGVGSSSIAHNVAWLLSSQYKEPTILVDFDYSFGTAGLAFNIDTKQPTSDVLAQWDRLDEVLFEKCLVSAGDDLKVLVSGSELRMVPAPSVDAVEKVLDLARAAAGFVVLDLPHVWSEWTQAMMETVDDLVIVAGPDLSALRDCKSLFSILPGRRGINPTRLLLNKMDAGKKTELAVKDFEETTDVRTIVTMPFAPDSFGTALNNGQMIGEIEKSGRVVEVLRALTAQVSGRQRAAAPAEEGLGAVVEKIRSLLGKGASKKSG